MGKNRRIAINIVAQIVSFVINLGVSFVLTPYITAKLGKNVYGFVGLAYQVTSYISVFTVALNSMVSMFTSIEYYKKRYDKANVYFSTVAISNGVASLVSAVPLAAVVLFMDKFMDVPAGYVTDIKWLWALIFANFLINLIASPFGIGLFIKNRLDYSSKRSIESNVIKALILVIGFTFFVPHIWYIGFAALVCAIYSAYFNYKYSKALVPEIRVKKKYYEFKAVKELMSIGVWNALSQLTNTLINGLDLIVSNMFINSMAMGYISYAQTVPLQIYSLIGLVSGSFSPTLTKAYVEDSREEFCRQINSYNKIIGYICAVPILGFAVFGMDFYHLWLPTMTVEENFKINILAIMILLPTFFDVYVSALNNVTSLTKHLKVPVLFALGISVVNLVAELGLLKFTGLGIYAIELATAVLLTIKSVLFLPIYAAHVLSVKWNSFYRPMVRGVVSDAVIVVIYYVIRKCMPTATWMSFVITVAVAGAVGYFISYFVLLNRNERKIVAVKVEGYLNKKKSG